MARGCPYRPIRRKVVLFLLRPLFFPLLLPGVQSDVTGEHTCVVLRALATDDLATSNPKEAASWLKPFVAGTAHAVQSKAVKSSRSLPGREGQQQPRAYDCVTQ